MFAGWLRPKTLWCAPFEQAGDSECAWRTQPGLTAVGLMQFSRWVSQKGLAFPLLGHCSVNGRFLFQEYPIRDRVPASMLWRVQIVTGTMRFRYGLTQLVICGRRSKATALGPVI